MNATFGISAITLVCVITLTIGALGLRLSRAEAQDLHRSLVTWLAHTARTVTT